MHAIAKVFIFFILFLTAPSIWAQQLPAGNTTAAESAVPQPRLMIEETVFEAGTVQPDSVIHHAFVVKNEGDAVLNIKSVRPGCGCSVAKYDKTIAPGESGKIDITVMVHKSWGGARLSKTAWVLSDDPVSSQAKVTILASVADSDSGGSDSAAPSSGKAE